MTPRLPEATNLHFHGLHVSPEGSADNSFRHLHAGEGAEYAFEIPANHRGGTYWYHPHVHGSAARQVARGLAGVFVIRGELDQIPEIASATESVLVLQDFALDASGRPVEPNPMQQMQGREGNLVTVNGVLNPAIRVQRRGWIRLRILNASPARFYRLRLEQHVLVQVASDGGALPAPVPREEILLTPGERVEVMVRGDREPGRYRLVSLPYDRGAGGNMMGGAVPTPLTLATLQYEGETDREWELPDRFADIEPLVEPAVRRNVVLGQAMGPGAGMMGGGMAFTLNGRVFDPGRVDAQPRLGAVEEWEFLNMTTMDHPMHIHTNSFQVVERDGRVNPVWKDVVLVPARSAVKVRMRFDDFVGRGLYHCHILDHEDLGMMGVVEVG